MTDHILPARPLTVEEATGFRLACHCLARIGEGFETAPTLAKTGGGVIREAGALMRRQATALAMIVGSPGGC